ncbi:MAG: preprotein translocase subunit SecG [Mycoplasmataceae bacterium]|jgi:preprotein translocase subunit SecG|nr:preprotein translocase subunit SecG [Mycoplasmataceae bacterium]
MSWEVLCLIVISCLIIIIGLILSPYGTHSGLTSMNGQDLELFKKTKDRGMVKWLQIVMFLILITVITILIINHIINK